MDSSPGVLAVCEYLSRDLLYQFGAQVFGDMCNVTPWIELNNIRADHIGFEREQGVYNLSCSKASWLVMRDSGSKPGSSASVSKLI